MVSQLQYADLQQYYKRCRVIVFQKHRHKEKLYISHKILQQNKNKTTHAAVMRDRPSPVQTVGNIPSLSVKSTVFPIVQFKEFFGLHKRGVWGRKSLVGSPSTSTNASIKFCVNDCYNPDNLHFNFLLYFINLCSTQHCQNYK